MRLLTILVLGYFLTLTLASEPRWHNYLVPNAQIIEAAGTEDNMCWGVLDQCSTAVFRVQQRFERLQLHTVGTDLQLNTMRTSILWSLVPLCMGCLVGYLWQRQQTIAERLQLLELLEEFEGVKEQAFDLGHRASEYVKRLQRVQAERDDVHFRYQRLLSRLKVSIAESSCQTDVVHGYQAPPHMESPPPLAGECSTPELEQLVVNAPVNDTTNNSIDQWATARLVSAAKVPSATMDGGQEDVADLTHKHISSPVACVVEAGKPAQDKQHRVDEQTSGAADSAAGMHVNNLAASLPAPAVSVPAVATHAVTSTSTAAQPLQLQLQILTSADNSLVCEQMKVLLQKQDVERLEQQKQQLKAETELMSAQKRQLEAEVTGLQHNFYVNTSRGSRTPLAFGSMSLSNNGFSPFPYPAQMTPGFGVPTQAEPGTSNTASSSFFRPPMAPGSMSPPGSAGSNRLSSPMHAAVSGSPYTTGSSAGSAIGARSKQPVQPLPMRPLEVADNTTPRSPRPPVSPAHEVLKADAALAARMSAQRKEESAKQRHELSRLRSGSIGAVQQTPGTSSARLSADMSAASH